MTIHYEPDLEDQEWDRMSHTPTEYQREIRQLRERCWKYCREIEELRERIKKLEERI